MTDAAAPIRALIKEAKTNLARLEEKAGVARIQIESLERALKAVEAASGFHPQETKAQGVIGLLDVAAGRRRRSLTIPWGRLLNYVGEFPQGIKSNKIYEHPEAQAMGIDRNNLRSQLHNYSISNVLERVSPGVFRLTDYGRELVNAALENDALEKTVA